MIQVMIQFNLKIKKIKKVVTPFLKSYKTTTGKILKIKSRNIYSIRIKNLENKIKFIYLYKKFIN